MKITNEVINVSPDNIKSAVETMLRTWGKITDSQNVVEMYIGNTEKKIVQINLRLQEQEVERKSFG